MIQVEYQLNPKLFRKTYAQVVGMYYIKLYLIVLAFMLIFTAFVSTFKNGVSFFGALQGIIMAFFPVFIISLLCSYSICYFDTRKTLKNYPELTDGNFKVRFDRNSAFVRINQTNNRYAYKGAKVFNLYNGAMVLYYPNGGHLVVPGHLLTKEEIKKVKNEIRAA